jgi:hypothetical protein
MNTTTTLLAPMSDVAPAAPGAPRLDLYVGIHKALRCFMADALTTLGRMDADDADSREAALVGVEALLSTLRSHLMHENDHMHAAIEARRLGAARHTADDHLLHLDAIANLEDETRAVRDARDGQRDAAALRLYRHLSEFVADNLQHMLVEESKNNATLWALYSDEELAALHDRLVATVPPAEMAMLARWFGAALTTAELSAMFLDMRQKAPPPAFEVLLDIVRRQLDPSRWARLARALGRSPVPGLIAA